MSVNTLHIITLISNNFIKQKTMNLIIILTALIFCAYYLLTAVVKLSINLILTIAQFSWVVVSIIVILVTFILFGVAKVLYRLKLKELMNEFLKTNFTYYATRDSDRDYNSPKRILITEAPVMEYHDISDIEYPDACYPRSLADIFPQSLKNCAERSIRQNLEDKIQINYLRESIPELKGNWHQLSVRKLQKICTQINETTPNSITNHYSRKINKRLLVAKIEQVYC